MKWEILSAREVRNHVCFLHGQGVRQHQKRICKGRWARSQGQHPDRQSRAISQRGAAGRAKTTEQIHLDSGQEAEERQELPPAKHDRGMAEEKGVLRCCREVCAAHCSDSSTQLSWADTAAVLEQALCCWPGLGWVARQGLPWKGVTGSSGWSVCCELLTSATCVTPLPCWL